jgi:cell wall-associated NlpC family hydrolase
LHFGRFFAILARANIYFFASPDLCKKLILRRKILTIRPSAKGHKALLVENMLKNLLTILSLACLATGCTSLRPSASRQTAPASTTQTTQSRGSSIEFINTITIKPDARTSKTGTPVETPADFKTTGSSQTDYSGTSSGSTATAIENYPALQFKYAILENARVEDVDNPKLLSFMEYWYGTPYHYGGSTRNGIDCSAFSGLLQSSVFGISSLPRMAKDQYEATKRIKRGELREGDLVFFHTLGRRRAVTHVGVYLRNNKFIHASVSGVMISDMNDGYYDLHYIGAGRITDQPGSVTVQATLTTN